MVLDEKNRAVEPAIKSTSRMKRTTSCARLTLASAIRGCAGVTAGGIPSTGSSLSLLTPRLRLATRSGFGGWTSPCPTPSSPSLAKPLPDAPARLGSRPRRNPAPAASPRPGPPVGPIALPATPRQYAACSVPVPPPAAPTPDSHSSRLLFCPSVVLLTAPGSGPMRSRSRSWTTYRRLESWSWSSGGSKNELSLAVEGLDAGIGEAGSARAPRDAIVDGQHLPERYPNRPPVQRYPHGHT